MVVHVHQLGTVITSFLVVLEYAPAVLDVMVLDQSNDSVTLAWALPYPASLPNTYNISYMYRELAGSPPRMSANWIEISDAVADSEGNVQYTLSSLLPYTQYYITITTIYDTVESDPSLTVNATTDEGRKQTTLVYMYM